jgi:hypothetical protein
MLLYSIRGFLVLGFRVLGCCSLLVSVRRWQLDRQNSDAEIRPPQEGSRMRLWKERTPCILKQSTSCLQVSQSSLVALFHVCQFCIDARRSTFAYAFLGTNYPTSPTSTQTSKENLNERKERSAREMRARLNRHKFPTQQIKGKARS